MKILLVLAWISICKSLNVPLILIATASLAKFLFIDSAIFKQNKYTPATHIPIVSPNKLLSDPPSAVIIMAASYSDEVSINLIRNYDSKISIAILRDKGLEIIR